MTTDDEHKSRLESLLPIAFWLPRYRRAWLTADIVAGVALAGLLIPEGMAYAGIVGVPPQAGLYAPMAGLFLYALFGSSRHLSLSATSATAVMTLAIVAALGAADPARYAALVAAVVIMTGLLLLVAGVVKLGFISDFMARPVITGFIFGLALLIIVRQLPKLLGTPRVSGGFFTMAWDVIGSLGQTNMTTLTLGLAAFLLLALFSRFVPQVPGALVVLVLGILSVTLFHLDQKGVAIVGTVPGGLPGLGLPDVSWSDLTTLLPGAAGIALVAYAEGLGTARTLAARHRYDIDPNQELKAMGAANLGSGLIGGLVVGGGLSGSSANESAGAKSEVSTLAASLVVVATLLFLTPVFHNLPEAALGAIVVHAVRHMLDIRTIRRYASLRLEGPVISLSALLGVLIFDILPGLVLAVLISLILLMREASRPRIMLLGRLPGERAAWVDAARHPGARPVPGTMVIRINGVLFFADADFVRKHILREVGRALVAPQRIIIDLEMISDIDITATMMISQLIEELRGEVKDLSLAGVRQPVRTMLERDGVIDRLGPERVFFSIDEALAGPITAEFV